MCYLLDDVSECTEGGGSSKLLQTEEGGGGAREGVDGSCRRGHTQYKNHWQCCQMRAVRKSHIFSDCPTIYIYTR